MKPYHRNPRRITKKRYDRLTDTLARLGDLGGIVHNLETDEIIGGNQRMAVFKNGEPVVVEAYDQPDEQGTVAHGFVIWQGKKYAYRQVRWDEQTAAEANIAANLGAGDWDWDALSGWDAGDLQQWGFDGELLAGWQTDIGALRTMLASEEEPPPDDPGAQIDKAAELREKWQTELGQLWAIGEHRLIVGDCRDPETWALLLAGDKANGVFTSPPYAEQRKEQYGGTPAAEYVEWWEAVQANVKANLAGDGSFFVNIKPHCEDGERVLYVFDLVLAMRRRWGWKFVDEFCWRKAKDGYPGGYPNRFRDAFEPIYHFSPEKKIKFTKWNVAHQSENSFKYSRGNKSENSTGSGFGLNGSGLETKEGLALPSNVLEIVEVNPGEAVSQAAMFPVALPDFFVRAYSDTGDLWIDPFCGSGTTIVAAHNNGRRGYGIELLPKYAAVILERLTVMTGQTPVLLDGTDNG